MTAVADWVSRVYADAPGSLVVNYDPAAGKFVGTGGQCATREEAVRRIEKLDADGAKGVYLRATTVRRTLAAHERGGAEDAYYLPGLWADVDLGTVGHKHDPARKEGRILPPDEDAARQVVTTSGLPEPTLWVHSGGGLYPWWLLEAAVEVTDENRATLEALSARWQEVIQAAAHRLGYEYGAGVGDLARVLRVPGTTNRKAGLERPCRVVEDTAQVYALDALIAALPARQAPAPATPAPASFSAPAGVWDTGPSPLDRFAASTTWAELLARYGFTVCGERHGQGILECFTRPGDPEHPCSAHVLAANPHALVVWSESAGLPTGKGQKLTKARVLAHMEHGGDLSAATRAVGYLAGEGMATRAIAPIVGVSKSQVAADIQVSSSGHVTPETPQGEDRPPTVTPEDAAMDAAYAFTLEVERESYRLRIREAARRLVDREKACALDLPAPANLSAFLAVPDDPITYRIDGLWPTGGRVVLSAPHKAGKTTTAGNLLRCLVDGTPFLETFTTERAARVVLIDNELDPRMLRRWLRDQGIENVSAVEVLPLRGRLSTFNILDPETRTRWAERIGAADVLIFDCLRPALDALGLSEDKEAGRFLEALDELTAEAGIAETLLVHHMGHNGERSRGDSRILDWPDVLWKLVKDAEDDEETTARRVYFTAYGRDVDQAETLLSFDPATRRLSVGGGTRRETRLAPTVDAVLEALAEADAPLSGRQLEALLTDQGHGRDQVRDALKRCRREGTVTTEQGPRRAVLHALNPSVRGSARVVRGRTESECASAPIGRTLAHSPVEPVSEQEEPAHSLDAAPPRSSVAHLRQTTTADPAACQLCGDVPEGKAGLGARGLCLPCEATIPSSTRERNLA